MWEIAFGIILAFVLMLGALAVLAALVRLFSWLGSLVGSAPRVIAELIVWAVVMAACSLVAIMVLR